MDEIKNPVYKNKWLEYFMQHDYLYYNSFRNCEEIKSEWETLHENMIGDIQNNDAMNVDNICADFLDGFDAAFYEKYALDISEKTLNKIFQDRFMRSAFWMLKIIFCNWKEKAFCAILIPKVSVCRFFNENIKKNKLKNYLNRKAEQCIKGWH